ncbi:hypothetical protein PHSY_003457 [Pseudozyma hubeiensis SY62]|uniref:LrgB-like protein n=1 Tax=Pseudozyma hubeiensis (strain SY62) TaxID=1305764 RepID=R9P3L9_PSEHS|nr:hypothetical protein PHSY_003457 [Pseudozyma hubeiensis SY62]GAC95879.1 hypothetical protein PHSY_003457 [Pseudozyma hubeiensis SY62]
MTNTPQQAVSPRRGSATSSNALSNETCEACVNDRPYVDRIRSVSHVFLALRLMFTDPQRRKDLFTNWVHVPVGITSLLFLTWLIKQAMDRAPFRFPSPVLAMVFLFALLLALDYLSSTRVVKGWADRRRSSPDTSEAEKEDDDVPQRKILLQPMLTLLEAPCDFCLRYMSVMFTPSFILIPAREIINGKEIGLITGYFAATQLLGLIFPVLLHKAIRYAVDSTKHKLQQRKDRKENKIKRADEQRRASVATLVAVMSNITPAPAAPGLIAKADTESTLGSSSSSKQKNTVRLHGGQKLGSIATGLSGMTAIATAPLTLNTARALTQKPASVQRNASQRQDARRQLEHVQLETARQQGDPYATAHTPLREHHHHYPLNPSAPNSPRPGSALQHNHRLHHHNSGYFARGRPQDASERPELGRSRSLARSWIGKSAAGSARGRDAVSMSPSRAQRPRSGNDRAPSKGRFGAAVVGTGSGLKHLAASSRRPQSASAAAQQPGRFERTMEEDTVSSTFDEYIFQARQDLIERRASAVAEHEAETSLAKRVQLVEDSEGVDPRDPGRRSVEASGDEIETLVMPTLVAPTPNRLSRDEKTGASDAPYSIPISKAGEVIPRPSKAGSDNTVSYDIEAQRTDVTSEKKIDSTSQQVVTTSSASEEDDVATEPEMDAIDRLIERLWTSIPWFVFSVVLVAGIPLFYLIDISLPLFLGVNLITFLASITLVPPPIRRYLHPILTTSIATVLILWAIGEIRGWSLRRTLNSYSVDAKYTVLWALSGYTGPVIGAGDVLFSTLDAGIVSLAIPMYRYRWDLWLHLTDMLIVLLPCSMLSLFVWPTIAAVIGIAPERALAFASRFMSTPLAIELSLTIGADESITVVLVVITGILISIFKDPFFRLFRLQPDQDGDHPDQKDYLTIGIAMGSTAGAIGASSLISRPRCMAIASLSFVLFGAILLIAAAIPQVVDVVRMLAKAPAEFTPAM